MCVRVCVCVYAYTCLAMLVKKKHPPAPIGDLAFLRPIHKNGRHRVLLLLMDCMSRYCFLKILKNASSKEVSTAFDEALEFFGVTPQLRYRHFACDRG